MEIEKHEKAIASFDLKRAQLREHAVCSAIVSATSFATWAILYHKFRKTGQFVKTRNIASFILLGSTVYICHNSVHHKTIGKMEHAIKSAFYYEQQEDLAFEPKPKEKYPLSASEMRTLRTAMTDTTIQLCEEGGEFLGLATARSLWNKTPFGRGQPSRAWRYEYDFFIFPRALSTGGAPSVNCTTNVFDADKNMSQMIAFY